MGLSLLVFMYIYVFIVMVFSKFYGGCAGIDGDDRMDTKLVSRMGVSGNVTGLSKILVPSRAVVNFGVIALLECLTQTCRS